jgi:hypothetical protein
MSTRAADDFVFIRNKMVELRKWEGRQPIEIAGPAGNPTQPMPGLGNPDFCSNCGANVGTGMAHALSCPCRPHDDDYYDGCY